jgi:hypothetical protein
MTIFYRIFAGLCILWFIAGYILQYYSVIDKQTFTYYSNMVLGLAALVYGLYQLKQHQPYEGTDYD